MVNKRVGSMRRDNGRGGGGFEYVPAKSDFVKKQTERRLGRQFDGIFKDKYLQLSKLQEGDNRFRILPATWKPHDDFAKVVWVHKYLEGGSYVCLAKNEDIPGCNGQCPICDEQQQAKRDKDEERARELSASETMVCWVIDRKSREFEDRPQLYAMPPTLYKDICSSIYDTETGKATMIDHDRKGYDIRVKRTGVKLNTRYLPMLANTPSPISADRDAMLEILAYITKNPVPDCLEVKSERYLEKIMSGTGAKRDPDLDEDDEDDEDEAPKKKKRGAKAYDGDEDEEPDEDEDDEPSPKKKRPKLRAADEDEEPDEDEDDEPDESAPKKRRKLRADDADDDADGDEEDEPAPKKRRKLRAADDEDADEDDAPKPRRKLRAAPSDDEDDADEDAPPKRPKVKARAEPDEDDEDTEDDTDDQTDEDEDEAPPLKRRGRSEGRRASR